FGAKITPLLPERSQTTSRTLDVASVNAAFAQAQQLGRTRRDAQLEMAHLAAETLRTGGYAVIEAGTGIGKSQGYLIPAALSARATGRPVALSTYTRVLQAQLVERELPFVQHLLPDITYCQLQGRANYLSLSRLAEEVEDALTSAVLPAPRAWMLAALVRFAASSTHGNLDELGYTPQTFEDYLNADGSVLQVLASVRASRDDRPMQGVPDFYARARENAERADLVVVNHALLLHMSLDDSAEDAPFASSIICDEAHNLEDAATSVLEQRVEEQTLRRLLRAIYDSRTASGLVRECRRRLGLSSTDETLVAMIRAVDDAQAALDSLSTQLNRYVASQTVVARSDLQRYGVRVRLNSEALTAVGGPALKTAQISLGHSLNALRTALESLIESIQENGQSKQHGHNVQTERETRRVQRLRRFARSLSRDLKRLGDAYTQFWSFRNTSNYVRVVELGKLDESVSHETAKTSIVHAPVTLSAVPINVGPLLWDRMWSRLDTAICTSATLTVYGQGFDFFLSRIGLEEERIARATDTEPVEGHERASGHAKKLVTRELPPAFDYSRQALFVMPNDLPAPRDSDLKRNFPEAVADLLRRFIPFFGGKTLALFTANSRRDFVYERIADSLAERGYPVLRQGQGSVQRVIDDFRTHDERSLLGSRSLWEGVDVPGESLSYVFLEKLPYPSLGDPIEAARMSA
ncbi:MAG TPA: hypothetical protein DHW02_14045, partial [Ktedonobacter sp.]|nr:hypothetical protein [Ktedonobacter sp.]